MEGLGTSFLPIRWRSRSLDVVVYVAAVLLLIVLNAAVTHQQQISHLNTPPVMYVDRNWRISEHEHVGAIVTRVRAEDAENDALEFGLEPLTYGNLQSDVQELPFRIDPDTGIVYLNESLIGKGGKNFFLYVTVSDGTLTAKNEVYVNILSRNSSRTSDVYRNQPPSFTPNVESIRKLIPPLFNYPARPPPPINTGSDTNNFKYQVRTYPEPYNASDGGNPAVGGVKPPSSTKLAPVQAQTELPAVSQPSPKGGNSTVVPPPAADGATISPILPVLLTVFGIFATAGLIALVMFRKYLCAITKTLKKKNKIDKAKKSNQSNVSSNMSSNLTDDSRNSIVMHQWSGPLAFNNRYTNWENQHVQATSQLSNGTTVSGAGSGVDEKDRWEFPRHRLKVFNILGEGAFGQVWRCEATNIDGIEGVTIVAVKTLKENATESERQDLLSELQVMKSLEPHINVVRLLGCCTEKEPIFVILEYVARGKLQTYLRNSRMEKHYGNYNNTHGKSKTLTSGDLTSFMYQVARGMDFLTSRGIIHRDLAARNILITEDHTCKVADFGFARDIVTSKVYERKSEGRLPIRWMAIESLYDNIFSVKSDIWSFGVLMWEIVTLGSTPYPGISAGDVMRKVRDGYRLEKPEHCRRELYNIMYYCWAKDANERPGFGDVVQMLDKLLHTEMDYIELERFPDHNYYNMMNQSGEKL